MESSDSLATFFYNIVPGTLFILFFEYLFDFLILKTFTPIELFRHRKINWEIILFFLIAFGLLLGFVFQALTKLDRGRLDLERFWSNKQRDFIKRLKLYYLPFLLKLDIYVWKEITKKDKDLNSIFYNISIKHLNERLNKSITKNLKKKDYKEVFYLMHDHLLANGKAYQTNFYRDRLAFWANIFFANFIILLLILFSLIIPGLNIKENINLAWLFLVICSIHIFSRCFYIEYLRNLYDVVLKTFVSVIKFNKEKNKKRG